jgi:uncharacterized damage-inducible protein DinB
MQPDQAMSALQMLLPSYESEIRATRRVIGAIPEDQKEYKPHEKNMSAVELAWHITSTEVWFLSGIADGKFDNEADWNRPASVDSVEKILAWYDENRAKQIDRVKALSPEQLAKPVDFFGIANDSAVTYLTFCANHTIHHRGQLSVYLRPMGAKVPSIYGGSADEPFQAAAQA